MLDLYDRVFKLLDAKVPLNMTITLKYKATGFHLDGPISTGKKKKGRKGTYVIMHEYAN